MHDLLVYCCKNWPKETIPPNLHMLEYHVADFIGTLPSSGHGVYGEHGLMVLHPFIRYSGYCKEHTDNATSQDTSVEYAKKRTL